MKCPQTPDDYLVVRIHLVRVRKGLLGLLFGPRDETIGFRIIIEPTANLAVDLASKVFAYADSQKSDGDVINVK